MAGETVPIVSYLHSEEHIRAARRVGADAIHPGYGFLAENADFAEAVEAAGLVFVGPTPNALRRGGDKLEAKRAAAVAAARREAKAAFGDETVFFERYLERPRHVEIQLLADEHGHIYSLGERDCSIQRRHQKVLEEAPSPAVDTELRERMGGAAIAFAQEIGYRSLGTVEFLLDGGDFYFLELNGRIQVEHPVTFLPQAGTVERLRLPDAIRVDAGVAEGDEVGVAYDPMIAKLIASGETRAEALDRLGAALAETEVEGITTNLPFLRWLVSHPVVRA